jgi:glycosyltransferase involved in cell wall biosynthesis
MLNKKINVLFITNVPSPYMVNFFNLLGKKIELTVIFEKNHSKERNSSWKQYKFNNFVGIILKGISTSPDSAFSPTVLFYLFKKYDFIFVNNPTTPTGILAIIFLKFLRKKYIIESEGAYPTKTWNIKELIKAIIFSNAWHYFSGNPSNDSYFLKYNKEARITRYPFSSIFKKDIITFNQKELLKQKYRDKLGYAFYNKIIIMVGRFIPLKRFDLIINYWERVSSDNLLLIIGEGNELNNYLQILKNKNLKNVKIIPFQDTIQLNKYYILADLLIHPTSYDVWGLIINESFAKATPVITSKRCLASEVMLENFKNGVLIDFRNNSFIDEINKFLNLSIDEVNVYSKFALVTANKFTIEKMVSKHLSFMKNRFYEKK